VLFRALQEGDETHWEKGVQKTRSVRVWLESFRTRARDANQDHHAGDATMRARSHGV